MLPNKEQVHYNFDIFDVKSTPGWYGTNKRNPQKVRSFNRYRIMIRQHPRFLLSRVTGTLLCDFLVKRFRLINLFSVCVNKSHIRTVGSLTSWFLYPLSQVKIEIQVVLYLLVHLYINLFFMQDYDYPTLFWVLLDR